MVLSVPFMNMDIGMKMKDEREKNGRRNGNWFRDQIVCLGTLAVI